MPSPSFADASPRAEANPHSQDHFGQESGLTVQSKKRMPLGIEVLAKSEDSEGHTTQKLIVSGEELKPDKSYSASFVTVQGVPARYRRNRGETPEKAVEVRRCYLGKHARNELASRGTFTLA